MHIPAQTKPALWGAVGGAVALAIVGFSWGGWVTGGTAEARAAERANTAVVTALAPICVENFRQEANAEANLAELRKVSSWQQGSYIEKGGWAKIPGATAGNSGVATACAAILRQTAS